MVAKVLSRQPHAKKAPDIHQGAPAAGKRSPTKEELQLQALEKAIGSMDKQAQTLSNTLNSLTNQVVNRKRETLIDAEYVRLEIKKLTERSIQELRDREKELLMEVDILVAEAHGVLETHHLELRELSSTFLQKREEYGEQLQDEVLGSETEKSGVPGALINFHEEVQQTINYLKSNESKFKHRWMGFRAANEPNFKASVKHLGFVGISDPRVPRPWRRVGGEGQGEGQFRGPVGIDVHRTTGHIFISDFENHRIQGIDLGGVCREVFGSKGSDTGFMKGPNDVKCDGSGRYVVADTFNHRISWYNENHDHVQSIGKKGTKLGEFDRPRSLATTTDGNVVVADTGNQRIQVFSDEGEYLFSFGELGKGPGQFKGPHGITVDSEDNIYVADLYNHRIQVFTNEGKFIRLFGKEGPMEGELCEPRAIAFIPSSTVQSPLPRDSGGMLVIAEMENKRVSLFSTQGQFLCCYGDTLEAECSFGCPSGLCVDDKGRIFVSDSLNNVLHIL